MESSGIDTFRAMEILRGGAQGTAPENIDRALEWMKTGVSPAKAWAQAGLLQGWQSELLDAGFASGRGEWALRSMAESLIARAARWKRFKSKMVLPFAVMTLAGLLWALPALVANEIGFFGFLFRIVGAPAAIGGLIVFGIRLLQSAEDSALSNLIINLPMIGPWLKLRTRADFLAITTQSLRAGIPALSALPLASGAIRPPILGRPYAGVTELVAGGMPVAEALRQNGALDAEGFALVNAGEQSGALDDMLERSANAVDRDAQAYADHVTTLVPRLIYVLIAGMMLLSIIGFWTSYSPTG
jgi:type II secretory pathway component PulF